MKQIGKLQGNSDNSDAINNYFTIEELKRAVNQGKDTSQEEMGQSIN